jgi:hypothetical protein
MSAKPWHRRWHGNALNGMRGLSLELRGAYQTLQDLMYDHGGPIRLDERRLCGELDCDMRVFRRVLGSLIGAGKIRLWIDGPTAWIVNNKVLDELKIGGFTAESSAELTADLRDKFAIANPELSRKSDKNDNKNNGSENRNDEKPSDRGRGKTKTPKVPIESEGEKPASGEPEPDAVRIAYDLWNDTARRCGLPLATDLTAKRRTAIAARLEGGGLGRWREALLGVERSRFCRGLIKGKDFKAHLDFVCQPSSFPKLIEGSYGIDVAPPTMPVEIKAPQPGDRWRAPLRRFKIGGYWNTTDDGPKPGHHGCEVPADILAEFDLAPPLEVGAEVVPFPTPADRSAA